MVTGTRTLTLGVDAAFDAAGIRELLSARTAAAAAELSVFPEIGSTNTWLLQQAAPPAGRWTAAITDHQTQGRGRHGNRWQLPRGAGVCCSIAWTFAEKPDSISAITLAFGVAALGALTSIGASGVLLKWPNDIVCAAGKLGGILVEVSQRHSGELVMVAGIGVNRALPAGFAATIGRERGLPPVDLGAVFAARSVPSPQRIAAALIEEFTNTFRDYAAAGFEQFRPTWQRADFLYGRRIEVVQGESRLRGRASGIGASGELLLDLEQTISANPIAVNSGSIVLLDDATEGTDKK